MNEFVGVVDPIIIVEGDTLSMTPLKRHALVFDRLAIPNLTGTFLSDERAKETPAIAEMRWLTDRGILFDTTLEDGTELSNPQWDEEFESSIWHALGMLGVLFGVDMNRVRESKMEGGPELSDKEVEDLLLGIQRITKKRKKDFLQAFETSEMWEHVTGMTMHQTRCLSIMLREANGLDAYPLLSTSIRSSNEVPAGRNDVVRIVLNFLPIPDDITPWEQIIEFRSDPDSRNKFIDLRNWMGEVAREELRPNEVVEKLEYLISRYQRHLELHRMKTNTGTLETVVVTSAEVLGDLVSFKWGKAAEALFSLKRRNIALLEGELTAPGNEVAYIVKAREHF